MQPSGQAVLPALHPKRNLHWSGERGTAIRRAEAATRHSKLRQLLQERQGMSTQCATILHREGDIASTWSPPYLLDTGWEDFLSLYSRTSDPLPSCTLYSANSSTVLYVRLALNLDGLSYPLYSTVQYSTVQYSTVQYSTVQYSTVQYSTVPVPVRCNATQVPVL